MDMSIWEGELLEAFAALELSTLEQAPTASWDESSMGLSGDRDKLFGRGTEIAGWTDLLALSVLMLPVLEQAPTAPWGRDVFGLYSGVVAIAFGDKGVSHSAAVDTRQIWMNIME